VEFLQAVHCSCPRSTRTKDWLTRVYHEPNWPLAGWQKVHGCVNVPVLLCHRWLCVPLSYSKPEEHPGRDVLVLGLPAGTHNTKCYVWLAEPGSCSVDGGLCCAVENGVGYVWETGHDRL
jgi:hypothetical protein